MFSKHLIIVLSFWLLFTIPEITGNQFNPVSVFKSVFKKFNVSPNDVIKSNNNDVTEEVVSCINHNSNFKNNDMVKKSNAHKLINQSELPEKWFWGNVEGKNYLTQIRTEHAPYKCQSCWALIVSSVISDRFGIALKDSYPEIIISPQVLINCVDESDCSGGNPYAAYEYIYENGIPDETCQNYAGHDRECDLMGICEDCISVGVPEEETSISSCFPIEDYLIFNIKEYGYVSDENEVNHIDSIKSEIYLNGPVSCEVTLPKSFLTYNSGVMKETSTSNEDSFLHFISIVGWDTTSSENGEYWICRNSWGTKWGDQGYFKLGIDQNTNMKCSYAIPETSNLSFPIIKDKDVINRGMYKIWKNVKGKVEDCLCATEAREEDVENNLKKYPSLVKKENIDIPESYDIRNINGESYAVMDRNQHIPVYCGSCWAFAVTHMLGDRFNIYFGKDKPEIAIAPQVLVNCVAANHGCHGGYPFRTFEYVIHNGIPHESCAPYEAIDKTCTSTNVCADCSSGTCISVEDYHRYTITDHGKVMGEEKIKAEITVNGPITCLMALTDEFHAYAGGIFNDTSGRRAYDHVVELAGWGEENGVKYWLIRNSWGTWWGERGWARIAIGPGDLGLATMNCDWATPAPPYTTKETY